MVGDMDREWVDNNTISIKVAVFSSVKESKMDVFLPNEKTLLNKSIIFNKHSCDYCSRNLVLQISH